ncbi:MAG TPA: ABC transporter permease [Thermoanaerobaculia bacterium]|nr:ABC transporter permease [Thermoanaerobaculia bacterium]
MSGARIDHLFLLRELVKRDFQSRYAGSALGFLWSLLQPLWQLALFTFVFSVVLEVSLAGQARTDSFPIFLFCALIPWIAVQEGVSRSTTAITDSAQLVKKMRFPPELLVLATVVSGLIQAALASIVLVAVLLVSGKGSPASSWVLLLAIPLQLALTLGLGLLSSTVHVFFRDTVQLVGILLSTWFYLTPIVYPLGWVPEGVARRVISANPLSTIVDLYRQAFLGGTAVSSGALLTLALTAGALLAAGVWLFRTFKPAFADEI